MFGASLFLFAAILFVNSRLTPASLEPYEYQMIQGFQLQRNSLEGNSLPSFTSTGLNESGSLGSTTSQSLRKVRRGEMTMIVGGQNSSSAVCLGGGRALSRFSVCPSGALEVRASPLGFIVYCGSGLIKLFNATCHLMPSFSLRLYSSTLAVLSSPDNVTVTAYIDRRENLVRYEFEGERITFYTKSDIASTFGTCSVGWSPRTYNDTHFIFECQSSKRYLVDGFVSNSNKEVLNGSLFINTGADEAVIITGDHSFTFYWNGFSSYCIINTPLSTSLLTGPTNIDFGKNNGQTVIVLFNKDNIFIFDTSRGCKDEFLQKLNISYPCVAGDCDGYFILGDKCILAVNERSSNKFTLDLFYYNNTTPHTVTNLQELPDVLNVNKSQVTESQVPTSTQVISSTISSQAITSTTSTMASSSSPSLLITTSSTTSSTLSSSPSPTLSPKTKVSPHLYYGPAIAITFGIIIITGAVIAVICLINHQKRKKLEHSVSISMADSNSNPSTRCSSAELIDVFVTADPRQESGDTAKPIPALPSMPIPASPSIPIPALPSIPIPASLSIDTFGNDYKRPTPEKSNPDPSSLVVLN